MPVSDQSVRKPSRAYLRRGHPIAQDVGALWPLFAGAGPPRDISGHHNTGTLDGPSWTTTNQGPSLSFDSSNFDIIRVTDDPSLQVTEPLTLGGWIKPNSLHEGGLISKWQTNLTTSDRSYSFDYGNNNSDRLRMVLEIGGSVETFEETTGALTAGEWLFAVGTYDGSEIRIYANGDLVGSTSLTGSVATSTNEVWLGRNSGPDESSVPSLDGTLSGAFVFDRALKQSEVRRLHANPMLPYITKPR